MIQSDSNTVAFIHSNLYKWRATFQNKPSPFFFTNWATCKRKIPLFIYKFCHYFKHMHVNICCFTSDGTTQILAMLCSLEQKLKNVFFQDPWTFEIINTYISQHTLIIQDYLKSPASLVNTGRLMWYQLYFQSNFLKRWSAKC